MPQRHALVTFSALGDAPAPTKKEKKSEISREFDCMLVPEVFGGGRPAQHVLQARQGGV